MPQRYGMPKRAKAQDDVTQHDVFGFKTVDWLKAIVGSCVMAVGVLVWLNGQESRQDERWAVQLKEIRTDISALERDPNSILRQMLQKIEANQERLIAIMEEHEKRLLKIEIETARSNKQTRLLGPQPPPDTGVKPNG